MCASSSFVFIYPFLQLKFGDLATNSWCAQELLFLSAKLSIINVYCVPCLSI